MHHMQVIIIYYLIFQIKQWKHGEATLYTVKSVVSTHLGFMMQTTYSKILVLVTEIETMSWFLYYCDDCDICLDM